MGCWPRRRRCSAATTMGSLASRLSPLPRSASTPAPPPPDPRRRARSPRCAARPSAGSPGAGWRAPGEAASARSERSARWKPASWAAGQLTVQQQVSDLLEAPGGGQLLHRVAAVEEGVGLWIPIETAVVSEITPSRPRFTSGSTAVSQPPPVVGAPADTEASKSVYPSYPAARTGGRASASRRPAPAGYPPTPAPAALSVAAIARRSSVTG